MKKILLGLGIVILGLFFTSSAQAATTWNTSGNYVVSFVLGSTPYSHDMVLAQDNSGNITGTGGGYPSGGTHTYEWVIDSGSVVGNTINLTSHYTASADAVSPLTVMSIVGTIAPDGSMSGTWSDNYQGGQRNGTWTTTNGTAKQIVVTLQSCPLNTVPTKVETMAIPSNLSTPISSATSLANGVTYLLVSSGTWQNSNLNITDTEYASVDNWATFMDGYNINPYLLGAGEFDLQLNGSFINWGSYNPTHQYSYLYTGTGSPISLGVFDGDSTTPTPTSNTGWYGDNSGSLSVDVYSCVPVQPSPVDGVWSKWTPSKRTIECGTGTFTQTRTCIGALNGGTCDGSPNGTIQSREVKKKACPVHLHTDKDCKKDGWKSFQNPKFKNQGQCVSYFSKHHRDNND